MAVTDGRAAAYLTRTFESRLSEGLLVVVAGEIIQALAVLTWYWSLWIGYARREAEARWMHACLGAAWIGTATVLSRMRRMEGAPVTQRIRGWLRVGGALLLSVAVVDGILLLDDLLLSIDAIAAEILERFSWIAMLAGRALILLTIIELAAGSGVRIHRVLCQGSILGILVDLGTRLLLVSSPACSPSVLHAVFVAGKLLWVTFLVLVARSGAGLSPSPGSPHQPPAGPGRG